ncbi:PLDc N-terminal domain-containing protein [Thermococcus sp.]|uniref:PLDc N-terminal domain-containing protein n=1 Tax=Thermococcus sp. TaxID=35749 RepID=UPI002624965A|nr:PLDc N-terminal domain-containing protein [Thermococcus sp.]MCD6144391.1 PLDc N-terminal domain-containing protein [Thermococcus sp.]
MAWTWWTMSLIVGLLSLLWVVYDIIKNQKDMSTARKGFWIVLTLLFSLIGAGAYYLVEKRS